MARQYKIVFIASLLLSVLYLTAAQVTTSSGTTWTSPGIYNYYVPANTARIGISCIGGSGGNNYYLANGGGNSAGNGASAYGEFYVTPGMRLTVVVGGKGGDAQTGSFSSGAGGGGGGSFVWNPNGDMTYPWVAAGGGGGSSALSLGGTYYMGQNAGIMTIGASTPSGGNDQPGPAGYSYSASASGGKGWMEVKYNPVGRDGPTYVGAVGGFGGGGANYGEAAGGGGGYSGGPAGATSGGYNVGKVGGGGGGSYVSPNGFRITIQAQSQVGNGVVTISTKLACQNGGSLNNVNTSCICLSGYKGISCELAPACQGVQPTDNQTSSYPTLVNDARFSNVSNNALNLVLQGSYVISRKWTKLTFSGGASIADSCTLHGGGSWWSQTFADGITCSDQLILALPWRNHTNCGFIQTAGDNSSPTVTYSSRMVISYSEDTGDHFGLDIIRTVTHAYNVDVIFPRNVQSSVSPVNIKSVVLFDAVLVDETYDYVNNQMKITLNAIAPWSSMLGNDALQVFVPSNMNLINTPVLDNTQCNLDPGSTCVQTFFLIVKLTNQSECTYDGHFKINAMIYSCRENNGQGCSSAPVNMTFTMQSGSICASLQVQPAVSAQLQIFHTLDFSDAENPVNYNYLLGEKAYFYMNINAGIGNTVSLTFKRISYLNNGTEYNLFNSDLGTSGFSADGQASKMALMAPGKYFTMYFSGTVFKIPFGQTQNFTVLCTATVTYDGNKKRDIEAAWGMDGTPLTIGAGFSLASSRHQSGGSALDFGADIIPDSRKEQATGVSLYTAVGIAAAGVVTGLAAVLAVVVVVFKKFTARLQQEKAATPLLSQSL